MNTKIAAIDGACYHNGKPDSYCVGACIVLHDESVFSEDSLSHTIRSEAGGTNQRGEIHGLICALEQIANDPNNDWIIVTDSEYVLNAINNGWPYNWRANDWLTASGDKVKNIDLWEIVCKLLDVITCDFSIFHIKGHVIPFGAVTRSKLLQADASGKTLFKVITDKYDIEKDMRHEAIEKAQRCAERNHSSRFPDSTLRLFVCVNMLADAFAAQSVDNYKAHLAS